MKMKCNGCDWVGESEDLLIGEHPFQDGCELQGCPECREIWDIRRACDEPGCREEATCGTPTPAGYRSTCGKHIPKEDTNV